MNIGTLLPRHARYRGDHLALIASGRHLTYRQLNATVNRLANALLACGLKKGEAFATVLPNCLELMASYWAAAKTGLVIVPMSPLLQASGLASLLRDSDARLVIGDGAFAATFAGIRSEIPLIGPDAAIVTGDGPPPAGFRSFAAFTAGAGEDDPPDAGLTDADVFNIMYSSGTTGLPKGIVHTHYVRAMYCMLFAQAWRMTPESVVVHAGSIVFNGAMLDLMPWMFVGGTYILHDSFVAERVIEDIARFRATHIVMVPAQIIAILDSPAFAPEKLHSLEMLHNVGAPLLVEYKKRINDALPGRFYELYGVTEGFVTVLDKHDAVRKLGSVGCPPPFSEIMVCRPDGTPCAAGEVGEICGRGPLMMRGYYKRDDLTRETIRDGWLHSGDVGYLDDEGYLFLVDRIKDMIISGGVNVYPRDIEEVVIQHEAVREVAVFGVADDKWGEVPVAAVALKHGASIEPAELIAWTNARVGAKFQRIVDVVIYDEFPRNVAGKTLKRDMRERYRPATGRASQPRTAMPVANRGSAAGTGATATGSCTAAVTTISGAGDDGRVPNADGGGASAGANKDLGTSALSRTTAENSSTALESIRSGANGEDTAPSALLERCGAVSASAISGSTTAKSPATVNTSPSDAPRLSAIDVRIPRPFRSYGLSPYP